MGWSNVPICDQHWIEEEGDRGPIRIVASLRDANERCYRCGNRTEGIYVRRNIPAENGTILAACARCGKEVDSSQNEASLIVLGMTYDDVAVVILVHRDCYDAMEKVYVAPRKSDGMSLIDAMDVGIIEPMELTPSYEDEPDRLEDA